MVSNSLQPHRWQPTRLGRPWDSPGKDTGVGCHFLLQCMKVKSESEVAQSCPTLSNPMDCNLPGSFIHEIFQARVLEWGAIAFSVSCIYQYDIIIFILHSVNVVHHLHLFVMLNHSCIPGTILFGQVYDPSNNLVISGFQYFIRIFGFMLIWETACNFLWCFCLVFVSWWCLPHRKTLEVFPLLLYFGRIYEELNYVQKEIKETLPFTIVVNKLLRNKFT